MQRLVLESVWVETAEDGGKEGESARWRLRGAENREELVEEVEDGREEKESRGWSDENRKGDEGEEVQRKKG